MQKAFGGPFDIKKKGKNDIQKPKATLAGADLYYGSDQ